MEMVHETHSQFSLWNTLLLVANSEDIFPLTWQVSIFTHTIPHQRAEFFYNSREVFENLFFTLNSNEPPRGLYTAFSTEDFYQRIDHICDSVSDRGENAIIETPDTITFCKSSQIKHTLGLIIQAGKCCDFPLVIISAVRPRDHAVTQPVHDGSPQKLLLDVLLLK